MNISKVLIYTILAVSVPSLAGAEDAFVQVEGSRLRSEPKGKPGSQVLDLLYTGYNLQVLEKKGKWTHVTYIGEQGKVTGWINSNLITSTPIPMRRPVVQATSAKPKEDQAATPQVAKAAPTAKAADDAPAEEEAPVPPTRPKDKKHPEGKAAATQPAKERRNEPATEAATPPLPPIRKPRNPDKTPTEIVKDSKAKLEKPVTAKVEKTLPETEQDAESKPKKEPKAQSKKCITRYDEDISVLRSLEGLVHGRVQGSHWLGGDQAGFEFSPDGPIQITLNSLNDEAIAKVATQAGHAPDEVKSAITSGYVAFNASICREGDGSIVVKMQGIGKIDGKVGKLAISPSGSGFKAKGTIAGAHLNESFSRVETTN